MENIGRILLKGVFQNSWIKIEYKNQSEEITHYMIGINDINPFDKKIKCDSFNIAYSNDSDERYIFLNLFYRPLCANILIIRHLKSY